MSDKKFYNKSGLNYFSIKIVKSNPNHTNLFIKIGKLCDKRSSVALLANIQPNVGI
ncbi:DUF3568 family protein [Francisella tularensis]|uniref:DUF3568 family protein n=1 Tax=Francisella tularensis TaxID=263 RepID=UPI003878000D